MSYWISAPLCSTSKLQRTYSLMLDQDIQKKIGQSDAINNDYFGHTYAVKPAIVATCTDQSPAYKGHYFQVPKVSFYRLMNLYRKVACSK